MKKYELQARIRAANPYKNMYKKTEEHAEVANVVDRNFAVMTPETVGVRISRIFAGVIASFISR